MLHELFCGRHSIKTFVKLLIIRVIFTWNSNGAPVSLACKVIINDSVLNTYFGTNLIFENPNEKLLGTNLIISVRKELFQM